MRLERLREELADARELRIGNRADARAADDLALERARAAAQRLRCVEDLFGGGQELAAGGREHHAARHALEQATPSSSSSALICALTAGWLM